MIMLIACGLVLLLVLFETVALLANTPIVIDYIFDKDVSFFILVPFPTKIFSLTGLSLQVYWVAVVAIIFSAMAYATWKLIDALNNKNKEVEDTKDRVEDTSFYWIGITMCLSIAVNFVIVFILMMLGIEVTVPGMTDDTEYLMFSLANAAVWEELVTRLLYIGVPFALISLIMTKKKESLKCLFGGFGMSRVALVLIIISGTIFGLAHYPGWDGQVWKVVATGIMGIFMGYIFVRFGLYATILMHFANNYLSSFGWMGIEGFEVVFTLFLLGLGVVAAIYLTLFAKDNKERITGMPLFKNRYVKEETSDPLQHDL